MDFRTLLFDVTELSRFLFDESRIAIDHNESRKRKKNVSKKFFLRKTFSFFPCNRKFVNPRGS